MYAPMYPSGMPNYGFNPYQQYPQQTLQYQQRQNITGRVVSSPEEITPQEVPTDGSIAFFPSADNSCIYGKKWMPDGSISTVRFVPDASEIAKQPDALEVLSEKVDRALQMLDEMSSKPKTAHRRVVKSDE